MRNLTDDDLAILAELDALRDQAVHVLGAPTLDRPIYHVRRAVEDRLAQLSGQVVALADANVHGASLYEEIETLARDIRVQNDTLRAHAERLEAAQQEAARLVEALADANASAALQMMEVDARREDAEQAWKTIRADQEITTREARELRKESAALAAANVEMLLVVESRADQLDDLERRIAEERAEKQIFREQALLDGLTGLYNRRYYDEQLRAEFTRARRYGRELSLAFIDVDHFKSFNDGNGHQAGDHLLAHLARLVRSAVRTADLVTRTEGDPLAARYGGEEFIVLLPETPISGALVVAERLRLVIEQGAFAGAATQPGGKITISVGIASISPLDREGTELARRADAALYRAKSLGRNRVVVADAPRSEEVATV